MARDRYQHCVGANHRPAERTERGRHIEAAHGCQCAFDQSTRRWIEHIAVAEGGATVLRRRQAQAKPNPKPLLGEKVAGMARNRGAIFWAVYRGGVEGWGQG